jgi:hypothetical protein
MVNNFFAQRVTEVWADQNVSRKHDNQGSGVS